MISNKAKYKEYIELETELYRKIGYKNFLHSFVTQCEVGKIYSYVKALRKDEYYSNTCGKSLIKKAFLLYYRKKHNLLGVKLGISIPINTFGKGLLIYHSQGIIVHRDVRCGENCKLHGLTCIGNNGKEEGVQNTPKLGDNIDIGVGAILIGDIRVANNVSIAAGAVLCKSVYEENCIVAGVPAKFIKFK